MATFTATAITLFENITIVQPRIEVIVRGPVECTVDRKPLRMQWVRDVDPAGREVLRIRWTEDTRS